MPSHDVPSSAFGLIFAFMCLISTVRDERINEPNCGLSEPVARVYNGKPATRKQVPWVVHWSHFSKYSRGEESLITCGGSIISPSFILTAAHCFNESELNDENLVVLVFVNTTKLSQGPWTTAKRIIIHPEYKVKPNSQDMALLQLSAPLSFDEFVAPVCLPKPKWHKGGKLLMAAGWGVTTFDGNGPVSDILLYTASKEAPYKECMRCIYNDEKKFYNKSILLCTYGHREHPSMGDSGGPATMVNRNGRSVQVGVLSLLGCIEEDFKTIYAKVSGSMSWIQSVVTAYEPED